MKTSHVNTRNIKKHTMLMIIYSNMYLTGERLKSLLPEFDIKKILNRQKVDTNPRHSLNMGWYPSSPSSFSNCFARLIDSVAAAGRDRKYCL